MFDLTKLTPANILVVTLAVLFGISLFRVAMLAVQLLFYVACYIGICLLERIFRLFDE